MKQKKMEEEHLEHLREMEAKRMPAWKLEKQKLENRLRLEQEIAARILEEEHVRLKQDLENQIKQIEREKEWAMQKELTDLKLREKETLQRILDHHANEEGKISISDEDENADSSNENGEWIDSVWYDKDQKEAKVKAKSQLARFPPPKDDKEEMMKRRTRISRESALMDQMRGFGNLSRKKDGSLTAVGKRWQKIQCTAKFIMAGVRNREKQSQWAYLLQAGSADIEGARITHVSDKLEIEDMEYWTDATSDVSDPNNPKYARYMARFNTMSRKQKLFLWMGNKRADIRAFVAAQYANIDRVRAMRAAMLAHRKERKEALQREAKRAEELAMNRRAERQEQGVSFLGNHGDSDDENRLKIIKCKVNQTRKIAYFSEILVFFIHDMEKIVTFDRTTESDLLCILLNAEIL